MPKPKTEPPMLDLKRRKAILIEAIGHCDDKSTILALEAVLIERAVKFLSK